MPTCFGCGDTDFDYGFIDLRCVQALHGFVAIFGGYIFVAYNGSLLFCSLFGGYTLIAFSGYVAALLVATPWQPLMAIVILLWQPAMAIWLKALVAQDWGTEASDKPLLVPCYQEVVALQRAV